MENLTITKERVLQAAAKCSTAKATLETLFPEAFEEVQIVLDNDIHRPGFRFKDGYHLLWVTNKSEIYLDNLYYKWEIKENGSTCKLIPTRKTF